MKLASMHASRFDFGLSPELLADELTRFADAIRRKEVVFPQKAIEVVVTANDDFTTRRLVLTYVEKNNR